MAKVQPSDSSLGEALHYIFRASRTDATNVPTAAHHEGTRTSGNHVDAGVAHPDGMTWVRPFGAHPGCRQQEAAPQTRWGPWPR